ncbi:GAF domain-containing protein [Desulfobacter latus]|uniref:GAF domain-containing protein n=1 Tax=Desulfobacter latus TaxID=2292 RepID=A0A850SZD7_9BACT|nr:GAF domain-containing protein [Desulfobacter latus]NWH06664.1 GAF domain-containing protein [Desulfobacter latus]
MDRQIRKLKNRLQDFIKKDVSILELMATETISGLLFKDLSMEKAEYISPGFWKSLGFSPDSHMHMSTEWGKLLDESNHDLLVNHLDKEGEVVLRFRRKEGTIEPYRCDIRFIEDKGTAYRLIILMPAYEYQHLLLPEKLPLLEHLKPYNDLQMLVQTRHSLIRYASNHSLEELLQKVLDDLGQIVQSPIGFYHFVNPDQKTLELQQWSTRTLNEFCSISGKGMHYDINNAGVWVECVHERKPVVHNDYGSLPHKKGLPENHAKITRELVVPVIQDGLIVAILGVGNKSRAYDKKDIEIVSYFADMSWSIVQKKKLEEEMELQKHIDKALANLSASLLTQTNLADVSEEVLEAAKQLTKSRYGYVGTYEEENGFLTCHTMTKDIWEQCKVPDKSIVFEKCTGLFGWVLDKKQPILLNDIKNDPRSIGTPAGHIEIKAFLGVPATRGSIILGSKPSNFILNFICYLIF